MSIENPNSVDGMGISKSDGKVVLTISDHLEWEDERKHFALLEKKIRAYLGFVKSGQLSEALPESKGRPLRIEVIYKHQLSDGGANFFNAARKQLGAMGIELTFNELPDKY